MRRIALASAFILLAVACDPATTPTQEVAKALEKVEVVSRQFEYRETYRDRTIIVRGTIEDDFRYQATLNVDGVDALEVVVNDDALALRLIDAAKIPALSDINSLVGGSEIIANALRSGQWVLDPRAAPPLQAPLSEEGSIVVGKNPILDAVYVFQYVRRAIDEGRQVWFFNPDDPQEYRRIEDPFPPPNKDARVKRYDILQPQLPRRSQRGTSASLPTASHFRKVAFYVKQGKLLEIREKIDYEARREFKQALKGEGPKFHLTLLKVVRQGKTREPIRVRTMSFKIIREGAGVKIEIPQTNVLSASLGGLFGPDGLGAKEPEAPAASPSPTPASPSPTQAP